MKNDWADKQARRWFRKWDRVASAEFEAWVVKALKSERRRAVRTCKHVKAHAAFNETDAAARNGYMAACYDCARAIGGQ